MICDPNNCFFFFFNSNLISFQSINNLFLKTARFYSSVSSLYSGSESLVSSICTDELSVFVNIALSSINTSLSSTPSVGELLAAAELELMQLRLFPMVLSNACASGLSYKIKWKLEFNSIECPNWKYSTTHLIVSQI